MYVIEVELVDRLDQEPGEVIGGWPVARVRRQEQRLGSIAGEEVLSHDAASACKRAETTGPREPTRRLKRAATALGSAAGPACRY
jgi:hypothetical protein